MSEVLAPFDGAILPLNAFDDIVFKDELVGSGVGVRPASDIATLQVFSPLTGTIVKALPHAFIVANDSHAVLVHIGIDTIGLHGDGFTCHIADDQHVEAGQMCFEVDADFVRSQGLALDTPVVVMESTKGAYGTDRGGEPIEAGAVLFTL